MWQLVELFLTIAANVFLITRMCSFMQICVANLLEPLVTISALVRVASWKDFTFIRLLDKLVAARTINLLLFLPPFVTFYDVFAWHFCIHLLSCHFIVIWIVKYEEIFLIVQKRVTKAALFWFFWTWCFMVQLRYVLINLSLAKNRALVVHANLSSFFSLRNIFLRLVCPQDIRDWSCNL